MTGAAFKAWEDEKNQLPNESEFNKLGGAGIGHARSCINTVEMQMNTSLEKLGDAEKKSLKAALQIKIELICVVFSTYTEDYV